MTTIVWTEEAQDDLVRLQAFLIEKDVRAAVRALRTIDVAVSRLIDFPRLGLIDILNEDSRKLVVPFGRGGYVLRYRLIELQPNTLQIRIVRVWHGLENRE